MSYIGNTNTTQGFIPAIDYFSGNGSTVAFTLSRPVASVAQVQANISNVPQNPSSAFSVSGNTITFTSAPPSGTNNIYVYYTSPITQVIAPSQGTVTTASLAGGTISTTADITSNGLTVGRGAGAVSTNTAVGVDALVSNTTASNNTAVGYQAGYSSSTGADNTAIGYYAYRNGTASYNLAIGAYSMSTATVTGQQNSGIGRYALGALTSGSYNIALGDEALRNNTTGVENTAVGYRAGYTNTTGANCVYLGNNAGFTRNANGNVCIGYNSGYFGTTGTFNTLVGYNSGSAITTGAKNTILGCYNGNQGGLDIRGLNNHIVLSDGDGNPRLFFTADGSFNVATAYSATTANAANLNIGSDGYFRRSTSSLKYKRDVQDATHGLAEVLQLRPVTYKGKDANDGDTVFGGLIAEEVHEIGLTEFVQYADDGTPDALAYGNMVSVLVKAIQEQQAIITSLTDRITALEGAK
jgi:hypothetical protein